jgi:hypothetical protein
VKRFIDLRGQGTGYLFAWWDTIKDEFEMFGSNWAWDSRKCFIDDYTLSRGTGEDQELLRYLNLIPEHIAYRSMACPDGNCV